MFDSTIFAGNEFAQKTKLVSPLFTIIKNINDYLNILYGLELLILSSGTGTRNCDIWRKLATRKKKTAKF